MIGRLRRDESGLTIVELAVATFIVGIVLAMVGTAIMMMLRAERATSADTESLTALRFARENIEQEVRQADEILDTSTTTELHLWLDADNDTVQAPGETVVWLFEAAPEGGSNLVRTVPSTGDRWVAAQELVTPGASTYDPFTDASVAPGSTTNLLQITLQADSEPGAGEIETINALVRLRNK